MFKRIFRKKDTINSISSDEKKWSAGWSQLLKKEDVFDYRKYREGNE